LFVKVFLIAVRARVVEPVDRGAIAGVGSRLVREWLLPKRRCQDVRPVTQACGVVS
jgi:hypothetical protein